MKRELTPDRWQLIERVYHAACERAAPERPAYLAEACGADTDLQREVESLLRYETEAGPYLERSALEESARSIVLTHSPLPAGRIVGGYEILSFLGAGGMGEVYRARDLRLEREIALKIIELPAAVDPAYQRRFEEEARAASGLTHPNIVTIYGVGDDADLAYIAMELVRGQTLRDRLVDGALEIGAVLDIALQLADALAVAHGAGIVHRDLKPENLMVTPEGLVKVLDFGIARRRPPVRQPVAEGATRVEVATAEHGLIVGTAGYMSPEQAAGRPADHRSDQFSFGAILHEMLSGRRAFEASTTDATRATIAAARLPLLAGAVVPVPRALRDMASRCLAPSPDDRYPETRELAADLRRIHEEWRQHLAGSAMTRRRALWLGAAAALATVGAATWSWWPAGPMVRSLAVLPFTNADADPDVEYLCDGITESLMRRVAYVPDLDVRSRSAAFNFKDAGTDAQTAGRRLRVDAVLSGSVSVKTHRLVVTAALTEVATGAEIWTNRYERPATELVELQHDLARAIVDEGIRRPPIGESRRRFDREITEDSAANDLYLRGLYLHRRGGERNYRGARSLLKEAVKTDPTFAIAHVSLASTYSVMTVDGFERPFDAWPGANRAVRRALEIDSELPEAHSERASAWFFFDHDWTAAETEWTRAVTAGHSPTLPDLLSASALKLWALGRVDDALTLVRRSRVLDPLTPRFAEQEADLLLHASRTDEAARVYAAVLEVRPEAANAWFGMAEVHRAQRRFDRAIDARRRAYAAAADQLPPKLAAVLATAQGENGLAAVERVALEAELATLDGSQARGGYVSPLDFARSYAQLGDRESAFRYLDAAFEERSPGLVFLKVDRAWHPVRADDRFRAAVAAMDLP